MEQCQGVVSRAARVLGITGPDLKQKINGNKNLSLRWQRKHKTPPIPVDYTDINRAAPTLPTAPSEAIAPLIAEDAMARLIEKEDRLVRSGLENIGISGEDLDLAVNLQKFHRAHFRNVVDLLGGGIARQFIEMMIEVKNITSVINDPDKQSVNSELALDYEEMLRKDRSRLLELMNGMYDRALKATLTAARIRQLSQSQNLGGKPPRSPSFGPLTREPQDAT